ncbi:MAG TPA: hypothetical protein VMM15_30385 [Bradyrhizobium sp.]|nr:hypothetical protein [Bradyrhizobium sp.]
MRKLVAIAAVTFLTGCGANYTTAYRTFSPIDDGPKSALIDAKQRGILAAPGPTVITGKEAARKVLICAEPSPDALSAISSSLSASFGGIFPSGTNVQAALAQALSETASQLGVRNATIQLLRDGLYRQCEAYLNGLIKQDYYEQISNKYVNAMVALLAIEQLAPVNASATALRASDGGKVSTKTTVNVKSSALPGKENKDAENKEVAPSSGGTSQDATNEEAADAEKESSTDEAEVDASGGSEATGEAPAPTASINLPSGNQRTIPSHVSRAVNTMVTWFLTKDTVDYCLRGLFSGPVSDAFKDVCKTVIVQQMTQQGILSAQLSGADFQLAAQRANPIVAMANSQASDIIAFVAKADGTLDRSRLTDLASKSGASAGTRAVIFDIATIEELRQFLYSAPPDVVNQLHAALKK